MLRFFFNRDSFMVRLMELIGLAGVCAAAAQLVLKKAAPLQSILFIIILAEYAFLRFCTFWRWYPKGTPGPYGIGLQFLKAIVPAGYILAIMMWPFVFFRHSAFLLIAAALLAVIVHVNIILIALHFKDRDKMPVNTYSMTR